MSQLDTSLPSILPIVLGYGRFTTTTELCLNTLLPQAAALHATVLAVDNGSPDDGAAQLERYKIQLPSALQNNLQIRLHTNNLGYGGGMNEAAKFGVSSNFMSSNQQPPEWLLLINSDTLFPDRSLQAWQQALACAAPHVGIVAPVTNNAGNAQKITLPVPSSKANLNPNLTEIERIKHEFETWSRAAKAWIEAPTSLTWNIPRADFFCIAVRTSVWQQLNGLDPIYGRGYFEDFDFSLRARAAGHACVLTEDCLIYHQGSASFKASSEQKQLIRRNHQIFKTRFPNALTPHARQSNLTLMEAQLSWLANRKLDSSHDGNLIMRLKNRWCATQLDLPRSFFKRWLWQRNLTTIQKRYPHYLSKLL